MAARPDHGKDEQPAARLKVRIVERIRRVGPALADPSVRDDGCHENRKQDREDHLPREPQAGPLCERCRAQRPEERVLCMPGHARSESFARPGCLTRDPEPAHEVRTDNL